MSQKLRQRANHLTWASGAHMYMSLLTHTNTRAHTYQACKHTFTNSTSPPANNPLPPNPESFQGSSPSSPGPENLDWAFQHWGTSLCYSQCWEPYAMLAAGSHLYTPCLALALSCPNSCLVANSDAKLGGRTKCVAKINTLCLSGSQVQTRPDPRQPNSTHHTVAKEFAIHFVFEMAFYLKNPLAEPGTKDTSPPWLH